MTKTLFNSLNTELAALLQGDPDLVHYRKDDPISDCENPYPIQIAPGMMQLLGFISHYSWQPGHLIDVRLHEKLVVPNPDAKYHVNDGKIDLNVLTKRNDTRPFSSAELSYNPTTSVSSFLTGTYEYELINDVLDADKLKDWENFSQLSPSISKNNIARYC